MNFANLTNEELVRHVDLASNEITTTDLERVLLGRFEALVIENNINAAPIEVLEEFNLECGRTADIEKIRAALQFAQDYDLDTVRKLLELASEHDIDTAELLKPRLELAALNKIFNPATTA